MATGLHNLSITLPRTKVIEVLTEKRDEILAEFDKTSADLQAEHDGLPKIAAALDAWYIEIAALVANGQVAFKADGEVRVIDDQVEVPEKPNKSSTSNSKKDLKRKLDSLARQRTGVENQFNASILLLSHATNTDVEIPVGEYEQMLSQVPNTDRYYY